MSYPARAATLMLLSLLAGCSLQPTPSNVKVKQSPANGLTENSFDQGYLQNLSEQTRQAAEQSVQHAYERNNVPPGERNSHAHTSGRYELMGKHKLAIIDLSYSANPMRVTRIVGIAQDSLVTISCISPHGEPVDLRDTASECGSAVNAHFPASMK
jgi:hypothetical protein